MSSTNWPSPREIRVFISSTFRDMQGEREQLVKQTFPQLRRLCESRGVTWGEVDLRWGIPDEARSEGRVLPLCLAEIERCRPYFIGLLGERYGWIPQDIPEEMLRTQPWLGAHCKESVTALEILHGVLLNPAMAEHAFFYLRDPAYLNHLPMDANLADFRSESSEHAELLRQLKAQIRTSGFPVRENYSGPEAVGQLVLADFTALIDGLYPEASQPGPLDLAANDHDFYAASRARVYIRRLADFDELDHHAAGQGDPLVVLGEPGVGKSALIANWALEYRRNHPEVLVLVHFIGTTAESADATGMMRRVLGELQRRFDLQLEIPNQFAALRTAFADGLRLAAPLARTVLVLDGLNQLEDRDGALDLTWLPPSIPPNVRLIVSTLQGRPLDELRRRRWTQFEVKPLGAEERRELIREYLAQYAKGLSPARAERIAATDQTANPLFLRSLLEELRVFGGHDRLDERIGHYLEALTVPELFERILERWEADYQSDCPGIVGAALSLVWASRRGLSEVELLDLLGNGNEPIPRAWWSPLFLAAEASLTNRSGLIGFSHEHLASAVKHRYLAEERKVVETHSRLADYFEPRCRDGYHHAYSELIYQQLHANDLASVARILTNIQFVEGKCLASMVDEMLVEYYESLRRLNENRQGSLSEFEKFLQDHAASLRSHPHQFLQLANIQGPNSKVRGAAREWCDATGRPYLEPISSTQEHVEHKIRFSGHTTAVVALAFDDARGHLLSTDGNDIIRWDLASAAIVSRLAVPTEGGSPYNDGWKIAIARGGALIAVGAALFDAGSGRLIARAPLEGDWTARPSISPSGSTFAVCTHRKRRYGPRARQEGVWSGPDHAIYLIPASPSETVTKLPHPGMVRFCRFSPDSTKLVVLQARPGYDQAGAEGDDLLRVWDASTGQEIHHFKGRFDGAAFSPDGSALLATVWDTAYGWSTSDWSEQFSIRDYNQGKRGVEWLNDSCAISWGSDFITLLDTHQSTTVGQVVFKDERGRIEALASSSDSQRVAIGFEDGRIELWNVESLRRSKPPTTEESRHAARATSRGLGTAFAPDGSRLAVGRSDNTVAIVDVKAVSEVSSRSVNCGVLYGSGGNEKFRFTPDGRSLVMLLTSSSREGRDVPTFGSVRRLSALDLTDQDRFDAGSGEYLERLCPSPDGTRVFVFRSDRLLLELRTQDLSLVGQHRTGAGIYGWALSPDGGQCVWGVREGYVVWSFAQREATCSGSGPESGTPVFSPDGMFFAVSDLRPDHQMLQLLSARSGMCIRSFRRDAKVGWHNAAARHHWDFSPDGRKILSVARDGLAVFDLPDGRIRSLTAGGFAPPNRVDLALYQFTPDGRFVVGVEQSCIRAWSSETGDLLSALPLGEFESSDMSANGEHLAIIQAGTVRLFRFRNLSRGMPIVTAATLYQHETRKWATQATALCPHCGRRFAVPASVTAAILQIHKASGIGLGDSPILSLPEKVWSIDALVSSCEFCLGALRFNPFTVGGHADARHMEGRVAAQAETAAAATSRPTPEPQRAKTPAAVRSGFYDAELARWSALPFWKRALTKKPVPPGTG